METGIIFNGQSYLTLFYQYFLHNQSYEELVIDFEIKRDVIFVLKKAMFMNLKKKKLECEDFSALIDIEEVLSFHNIKRIV
ncbi:hypothetical protein T4D_13975 [Trichinella pseudospiralis]|uniref:Uncharacterized protein n=1 Tax=Trichinella pseudospiralis TaxID=6337 RepID=A0A0V1FW18_TRIPS|nr:hypothetical protein T4D_13975 [Trichinella pseudospiralis]